MQQKTNGLGRLGGHAYPDRDEEDMEQLLFHKSSKSVFSEASESGSSSI